uniref:Sushi domain-containing protein n=1 Tax=Ciona savignyi TaxID=51511 RepID=H2ZF57_CIOSA
SSKPAAPPPLRTTTLPPPVAPVVCRNPSVPPFGVPSTATFPVGSVFTYQCQPGYAVAGDTFTLCQRDGTFQTTVTRCVLVSPVTVGPTGCRRPAAPSNGFILGESTFWAVGQMILYGCNSGFSLVGAETLPCQSDGSFGNAPQCINVAVPTASCTPNPPPNGRVRPDGKRAYLPGDTITYECRNGFVESGLATGICLPNGQWRTAPFSCRAAQG